MKFFRQTKETKMKGIWKMTSILTKSKVWILFLFSGMFLINCENGPTEAETPAEERILGTWEQVEYSSNYLITPNIDITLIPFYSKGVGQVTMDEVSGISIEGSFSVATYMPFMGMVIYSLELNHDSPYNLSFLLNSEGLITSVALLDNISASQIRMTIDSLNAIQSIDNRMLSFDNALLVSEDSTVSMTLNGSIQVPSFDISSNESVSFPIYESNKPTTTTTISINEDNSFTWLRRFDDGSHILESGLWSLDSGYIHLDYYYMNNEAYSDSILNTESCKYSFEDDILTLQLNVEENTSEYEFLCGLEPGTINYAGRSITVKYKSHTVLKSPSIASQMVPNKGSIFELFYKNSGRNFDHFIN